MSGYAHRVIERLGFLGAQAVALWAVDHLLALADVTTRPITLWHALALSCTVIVAAWVAWGGER